MKPAFCVLGLVLAAGACAGPRPPIPAAATLAPPPEWRAGAPRSGTVAVADRWWEAFGDPVIDRLVDSVVAGNDDLNIAATRVDAARAQLAAARGAQLPALDVGLSGGRTRSVNAFGMDVDQWAGQAEVQATFDTDLFGRLRSETAAGRATLLATRYARDSVLLAVETTAVTSYLQLRTLDARLALIRQTVDARTGTRDLIRKRFEAGYASRLELDQAEAELQTTIQLVPQALLGITKIENALSILAGRAPGAMPRGRTLPALALPEVPAQLPASILRARPDLAAAEEQIVAADRTLDSARAAFLPNISLSASGGGVASSLLTGPQSIFSLGGSILAPIFEGGRLKARARGAAAQRDEAAYDYRKQALSAFREVEDGLATMSRLGEERTTAIAQLAAVSHARDVAERRYRAGYSPFLDVLDAERGLLSSQLTAVQLQGDRLVAAANLFEALGGGWQRTEH